MPNVTTRSSRLIPALVMMAVMTMLATACQSSDDPQTAEETDTPQAVEKSDTSQTTAPPDRRQTARVPDRSQAVVEWVANLRS